jgi:hypothetical protein
MTTLKKLALAVVALGGMMLWAAPPLSLIHGTIYRPTEARSVAR